MKANITATKTDKARMVRIEFEDGSTEELVYGLVQDKNGAWVLPNTAIVDQEVRAILAARSAETVEVPDPDVRVRLASAVEPLPAKTAEAQGELL